MGVPPLVRPGPPSSMSHTLCALPDPHHTETLTSSMSVRKAAVEMGLLWEKTRKMVSSRIGIFFS